MPKLSAPFSAARIWRGTAGKVLDAQLAPDKDAKRDSLPVPYGPTELR
jgi:hypothetical protein